MHQPSNPAEKLVFDLNELQLYHVFGQLRNGREPSIYATDGIEQGRGLFEFSFAAWSSFSAWFKDPAYARAYDNPAWVDFCSRLEDIYNINRENTLEKAVEEALQFIIDTVGFAPSMIPNTSTEFGCFKYNYREHDNSIALHLNNMYAPDSPFRHMDELFQQLQSVIDNIADKGFKPSVISFDSWLGNIPVFQELWPRSFTESLTPTDFDNKGGYGWWGQFLSRTGEVNPKRAQAFKETGEFPFQRMHGDCPYTEFCEHIAAHC